MPYSYRLYVINPEGRFLERVDPTCDSDEQALEVARRYLGACRLEIWSGNRMVKHVGFSDVGQPPASQNASAQ